MHDAAAKKINSKQAARKKRQQVRERFKRAHRAEGKFARQLKQVATQVGRIVKKLAPKGVVRDPSKLTAALNRYAQNIRPWAEEVSKALILDISKRDYRSWIDLGDEIGRSLRSEIDEAPTGQAYKQLMQEQVTLIQSLPIEASQRVHKLIMENMIGSKRPTSVAEEIMKTEHVTKSRAMLIARTETTRSSTALTQARATYIGSEGYIWQTAEDSDVRDRHKHLQGKFIKWDEPPIAGENGQRYHAGAGPNCRCWTEPVLKDIIE